MEPLHTKSFPESSCYEDKTLRESLESSQVDSMIEYLSNNSDVRVKNQQRGDPDLTSAEKGEILRGIFEKDPLVFQTRFEKYLLRTHLSCFTSLKEKDEETQKILKHNAKVMEKAILSANRRTVVKNRRYEALQQMVTTGTYFNEEVMQRRNPILFDQLIGKYQSKEERAAFIQLSETSAAASTKTPLTDMFMAHMARQSDDGFSDRRVAQEQQVDDENAADEEYMDDDDSMEVAVAKKDDEDAVVEEIDDAEKDLLKEEFFTTMYRSFLEGKDEDFDYSTVDNNEAYDCLEVLDQDEEEKYFAADDSGSDKNMTPGESSPKPVNSNADQTESEDELDAYMKTLEAQLHTDSTK